MNTGHLNGQGLAELRGYNFQNLSSAPTTNLYKGRFYFNTTDNTLYVYNGSSWVDALSQGRVYEAGTGIDSTALAAGTIKTDTTIASKTDIGNASFVIQSNGTAVGTIGVNATTGSTINITSTKLSDISIASGSTNYLTYNNSNGQIGAKVDTTVTASSTNLVTSGAVQTAINNAIAGGMVYKGVWTATGQTDYSSITLPVKAGYMYLVSGSATIGGIEWNTDDYLVINADVAVGGTITDVKKIDNTEGSDIVRLNATQTLTNKTIDADNNTIQDLVTTNFKSGTVVTTITSSSTDTTLPTAAAVWGAVTSSIGALSYSEQNTALTASGGVCTWTVTHNLNNSNVQATVYEVSSGERVMYDYAITSVNVVTVKILSASNIAAGTYKVVVQG